MSAPNTKLLRAFDCDLHLSERDLELLRAAIAEQDRASNDERRSRLRVAMRALAVEARRRKLTVVDALVALKVLWPTLPEVRALRHARSSELLATAVELCIEEYYRPRRTSPLGQPERT